MKSILSLRNVVLLLLGAVTVVEGVLLLRQRRIVTELRVDTKRLETAAADWRQKTAAAEQRALRAEAARIAQEGKLTESTAHLAAIEEKLKAEESARAASSSMAANARRAETGGGKSEDEVTKMMKGWVELMKDPEAIRLMQTKALANVSSSYAGLFHRLQLDPEQLARFKGLLAEKQQAGSEQAVLGLEQGINPIADAKAFAELQQSMQQNLEGEIQKTLGDEKYKQYREYQQGLAPNRVVNQLDQMLSYSDAPLEDQQKQQLRQLFSPGSARISQATMQMAATILSPSQLQGLRVLQQAQQAAAKLDALQQKYTSSKVMAVEIR